MSFGEKKEFALEIKDSLAGLLVDFEEMQHPDEESHFYDESLFDKE